MNWHSDSQHQERAVPHLRAVTFYRGRNHGQRRCVGVLVSWKAYSDPIWHLPKANTVVAGRKAVETMTSGGWCASLRGSEAITVLIPRTGTGNWYQMDACLRGPGIPQQETELSSMLKSLRISNDF